jgi:CheY-like chemotaxis protein
VLLAEDHEVNRRVALGLLRHLGLTADAVGTGREAIEAVRARAYDLVLMDVQMPDIDGLDATRAIRAEIRAERQPRIVALTANALAGDAEACFAAGMDAFLAKPVRLDALRAALVDTTTHRAIDLASTAPTVPEPPDGLAPDAAHVLRSLRALSDNDDALCAEILDAYLRSDESLIADLRSGTEQAAGAAHKIKASSGTLGADALARRAALVEQQTRAGEAGAAAAARALADELDAFRETVREVRAQLPEAPPALTDAPQTDARRAS